MTASCGTLGMEALFLADGNEKQLLLLPASSGSGWARTSRGSSGMGLAQPYAATLQNCGLKWSISFLSFVRKANCGLCLVVYAGLNWARMFKFIDFGGKIEWILFQYFFVALIILLRLRKASFYQLWKVWPGRWYVSVLVFGQNYIQHSIFLMYFSIYLFNLHVSVWNWKMFEGLEPSSRLVFEKCLCSDISCGSETKTRGGGVLISNFSADIFRCPCTDKALHIWTTNSICTNSGPFSPCTPCYTELKPTLLPKSMSVIFYSSFSCIYHILFGNLVGHWWVEIASGDQSKSFFTAESILLMQKRCTKHLVGIIFIFHP